MVSPLSFLELALASLLIFASAANANRKPCSKPAVRREWSSISENERTEWIDAVKCLAKLPHSDALTASVDPAKSGIPPIDPESSYYDDLVYVHMDVNTVIHFTGLFLPWHRAYIQAFETALKEKCGFKGTQPYWDWTKNTADFFNSKVFDTSPKSGFGGDGDSANDFQITNGAFSDDFIRPYPSPHKIRRKFANQAWQGLHSPFADHIPDPNMDSEKFANATITPEEISKLVNGYQGDFRGFQGAFEFFQGPHSAVHSLIGHDMFGTCPISAPATCIPGPKWSPNDPLFFMHHSMVDKIWFDWQHAHKSNFYSFHGGSIQAVDNWQNYEAYRNGILPYLNLESKVPSDGMFEEYSIWDVIDTTGGPLCYTYA